ncbi:MAG TPA: hypothetical protein VM029_18320 [Opitutaceae bacterium]|nr:hypothetical protein [Opitutaceae bacterium]
MTDLNFPTAEDELTGAMRGLYAAPAGHAYWNELESRIMARVGEVELGWWTELDRWLKPALVAAAVLVITAGAAMFNAQRAETESAYDELFNPTPIPGAPVEASAVQRSTPEPRDNALRFIISK